jgi:hypothetical protein
MVSRTSHRSERPSRRAVRTVARVHSTAGTEKTLIGLATSRPARIAYVVLGGVGLAALAVALVGPRRLQSDVIKPLRGAIEPQAEKLWAESKPLRNQIAGLFRDASPSGRARLVRNFQSWIGHFHAT